MNWRAPKPEDETLRTMEPLSPESPENPENPENPEKPENLKPKSRERHTWDFPKIRVPDFGVRIIIRILLFRVLC